MSYVPVDLNQMPLDGISNGYVPVDLDNVQLDDNSLSSQIKHQAGLMVRANGPLAAAAGIGAAAGAPAFGIGAIPGAIAGAGAYELTKMLGDPLVAGVNSIADTNYTPPTQAVQQFMDNLGVAKPQNKNEDIVTAIQSGMGDAASGIGLGSSLVKSTSPLIQRIGTTLSSSPKAQALSAALGATGSEEAKDAGFGPMGQFAAGLAGGSIPALPSLALRGASLTPEASRLADILENHGIDLTAAQRTGSSALHSLERFFNDNPFTASSQAKIGDKQQIGFNRAVLGEMGVSSDYADPSTLASGKAALKTKLDNLTKNTTVNVDPQLQQKSADIRSEVAKRFGPDKSYTINSYLDDIDAANTIPGLQYQQARSQLGKLARSASDTDLSSHYKVLQSALDDAAFRNLSPQDQQLWNEYRGQYGNYKTIEKAQSSTKENTTAGNITPSALQSAAKTGNQNYASGSGGLNDLSRAGGYFLKDPVPATDNTKRTLMAHAILDTVPFLIGRESGGLAGGIAAAAAPAVGSKVLQGIYNAKPVQNYLINPANWRAQMAAALMGSQE